MNIIIYGRIPSKKNSTISFARQGRIFHMPSNAYRAWHTDACRYLMGNTSVDRNKTIEKANITITFFAPDKRAADLTNKAESIMDLLVDNKIISDDNWFVVNEVRLIFGGVDKEKPRAEINIKTI